jgi:hypothetical protein
VGRRASSTSAPSPTVTRWPTTVTSTVRRVPRYHSAVATSAAQPISPSTVDAGVGARTAPVSGVHQRPAENAGSP